MESPATVSAANLRILDWAFHETQIRNAFPHCARDLRAVADDEFSRRYRDGPAGMPPNGAAANSRQSSGLAARCSVPRFSPPNSASACSAAWRSAPARFGFGEENAPRFGQ